MYFVSAEVHEDSGSYGGLKVYGAISDLLRVGSLFPRLMHRPRMITRRVDGANVFTHCSFRCLKSRSSNVMGEALNRM